MPRKPSPPPAKKTPSKKVSAFRAAIKKVVRKSPPKPVAAPSAPKTKKASAKPTPQATKAKTAAARPTKEVVKKVPAKKAQTAASKKAAGTTTKKAAATVAKRSNGSATKKAVPVSKAKPRADRKAFLENQRKLLFEERQTYIGQAESLKNEADSLALEHEPGDVQFDEEGGEGGTANVDREMDLVLSAQARAAAGEIDRALEKIEAGTYGLCEQCGDLIPEARLQALPYAALCVTCKSGGLSSRR